MSLRPENYQSRLIDDKVKLYLSLFGAISIEGPKCCGKTWTALAHANSAVNLDDEEVMTSVEISTDNVFTGVTPQLIDEWSRVPKVWDAVRRACDKTDKPGNFIVTCSTKLPTEEQRAKVFHSGAGRFGHITMRPMSLFESGDSSGKISLSAIYQGKKWQNKQVEKATLKDLSYYIVRGGWPLNLDSPRDYVGIRPRNYISDMLARDIDADKNRSSAKMTLLLKSLARNESSIAGDQTLAKDISSSYTSQDANLSRTTVTDYLDVLRRLSVIEEQPAFSVNYRSSTRLGKTSVRHFIDPSLACAVLSLTPDMLMSDLNTFGLMFESLVIRDLRIYAETFDGKVFHFRDNDSGDEVDAILEFPSGDYAAIEIKLGDNSVPEAETSLKKFYDKVEKKPKFMAIIVGVGGFAYQNPDSGIFVLPITALRN